MSSPIAATWMQVARLHYPEGSTLGAEDQDPTQTSAPVSGVEGMSSDAFLREIAATPRVVERQLVGQQVAHFHIERLLGRGGMGEVYVAKDDKLRRRVALKVLPPEVVGDEERRLRFLREARAAAAVTHSHIVTIYEVGEEDDLVYIAMEYVEGVTLRERLADEGALSAEETLRLWRAMLRGVRKAHAAGIVHRDLKPDNAMLTDEGGVKLLDFGLAKLREADGARTESGAASEGISTEDGRVMGTPGYMSPEQAKGAAVDQRTDLFALGVVAYEMITGQRPFRGDSSMEVLVATARDEPSRPSRVRPGAAWLDAVILRCLAKDPEDRFADADAVLEALVAPAEPTLGMAHWAAGAAILGLVVVGGWALSSPSPTPSPAPRGAPSPAPSASPSVVATADAEATASSPAPSVTATATTSATTSAGAPGDRPPPPRVLPRPKPPAPAPPAGTASGKVNLGI